MGLPTEDAANGASVKPSFYPKREDAIARFPFDTAREGRLFAGGGNGVASLSSWLRIFSVISPTTSASTSALLTRLFTLRTKALFYASRVWSLSIPRPERFAR